MRSPIAQLDLTLGDLERPSPAYLDIEWEGICMLHICLCYDSLNVILGRLQAGAVFRCPRGLSCLFCFRVSSSVAYGFLTTVIFMVNVKW